MGLNFRLMKLNPNFQHMNKSILMEAYKQSSKRLIFLDYEVFIINYNNKLKFFIFFCFFYYNNNILLL
jgi:hypothetical protein